MTRTHTSIFLLLGLNCAYDRGGLSIAAVEPLDREFTLLARNVEGEECLHAPLMLPLSIKYPDVPGAVDSALRKVEGADALVHARVKQRALLAVLYNLICVSVSGDAVDTDGLLGSPRSE